MPVVLSSFTMGSIAVSVAEGSNAVSCPDPVNSDTGTFDEQTRSITFTEPEMGGDEAITHFNYREDGNVDGYYYRVEGNSLEPSTRGALAAVNREAPRARIFYPTEIRGDTGKHLGELLRGIANYVHECYVEPDKPNFIRSVEILLGDVRAVDGWKFWYSRYGDRTHEVIECLQAVDQVKRHPVLTEKYKDLDRKVREYSARYPDAEKIIERIAELMSSPVGKVAGYVFVNVVDNGRLFEFKPRSIPSPSKAFSKSELKSKLSQPTLSASLNRKLVDSSRAYEIELEELSVYKKSLAGWISQEAMDGFLKNNLGTLGFSQFDKLTQEEKEVVARLLLRRMRDRAKGVASEASYQETQMAQCGEETKKLAARRTVEGLLSATKQRMEKIRAGASGKGSVRRG